MSWWPLSNKDKDGKTCDRCGTENGLTRDDHNNVYCPAHRHLHD